MKGILIGGVLLVLADITIAAPVVYTSEASYLEDLKSLGYATISEDFEDDAVWGASRSPALVASTTSKGLIWESNFTTSTTGASGISGTYGFFSNPHGNSADGSLNCEPNENDFNDPCWQNDGWIITSAESETLYGIGGWIRSSKAAKVTFLLDGVNVNSGRNGEFVSGWTFVGVIDADGFTSVEILELEGSDYDQAFIWGDSFNVGVVPAATVDLSGTIKTSNGQDICALVLASGQLMFSCNPRGEFSLTDLPRRSDGTVKRQIYAHGFFPRIDVLTGSSIDEAVVMTRSGTCPNYNVPSDPGFFPDSAGKWIDISGSVEVGQNGNPVCAVVLASGQHMFSCDGMGNYDLRIPLNSNGQYKLQVYADGFAPAIQRFDEFSTNNTVKMARAIECQAP